MTDTETRPLPTDWHTLRAFLPPEPTDSTVANRRHAIARINALVSAAVHDLEQLDTVDRGIVHALVGAAITDDDLDVLTARLDPGNRPVIEHRLTQLRQARSGAAHKLTQAEYTDPAVIQWRARCAEVTAEWQHTCSDGDQQERFSRIADFARRH